jgi:hypothetical protein
MMSSGMLRRVVLTRATRRNIPEDTILHSHSRENLKSYIVIRLYVKQINIATTLFLSCWLENV